jgi:ABC-type antimicrobial peptide transport system permease subunit
MVVHSKGPDMAALRSAIRDEVRKTDPQMAVEFEDASDVVSATLSRQELGLMLMLLFGAAAVALAAVGIYGVIAYATSQRRGEVATRLALGATSGNVFWLVLKQGQWLTMIGAGIGLLVAYLAGRVVASRLYEVRASDPAILGGATVLVILIALLATMIPAYRASRIDASRVLRPD